MKEFVIYLLKSGACISVFLLIYQLFLRKATFFKFNRIFLMFGLLASVVIPLIKITYEVVMPFAITETYVSDNIPLVVREDNNISVWMIVGIIYVLGGLALVLRNVFAFRRLSVLMKCGEMKQAYGYRLIDSPEIKSPFSVLNYILMNQDGMSDTEKNLVLKHESTHISQKHWIDLLCGECMLVLQWFNPFMWIYIILQKENHEFLADQAVIEEGVSPIIYQAVLINHQFGGPVFSFSNSFNYTNQLNRLIMIKKRKSAAWRRLAVLTIIPIFGGYLWLSAQPKYIMEGPVVSNTPTNDDGEKFTMTNIPIEAKDSILILGDKVTKVKDKKGNDVLVTKDSIKVVRSGLMPNKVFNIRGFEGKSPFVIIDGVTSEDADALSKLSPDDIDNISVLKEESAIRLYGEKGKDGVILVTTKESVKPKVKDSFTLRNIPVGAKELTPLILLDGQEIDMETMKALDPNKIEAIAILKDESAIKTYGDKGKNGVIIIDTKKKDDNK